MAAERKISVTVLGDVAQASKGFKDLGADADDLGGKLSGIGGKAAVGAAAIGGATIAGGAALYKLGSDFDSVYDGMAVTTGKTGKQLDDLKTSFRNVAKTVPVDFETAGQAIGDLSQKLDLTGKPLEQLSTQMLNLSRTTGVDLKSTIDSSAKSFKDWGTPAGEMSGQLDKLFRLSQSSGVGFGDLQAKLDQYGPTLRRMGIGFDEGAQMIAAMSKSGVDADMVLAGLAKNVGNTGGAIVKANDGVEKAQQKLAEASDKAQGIIAEAHAKAEAAAAKGGKGIAESAEIMSKAEERASDVVGKAKDKLRIAQEELAAANKAGADATDGQGRAWAEYAAAIKGAATDSDAVAIAVEKFGKKAGPELADALRSGRLSVEDMSKAMDGAKGSINDTATGTDDAEQKMTLAFNRIKLALEPVATAVFAMAGTIAEKLGPALEKVIGWAEGIAKVFKENGIAGVFDKLGADIGGLWDKTLKPALSGLLASLGQWIVDNGPGIARQLGEWTLKFVEWVGTDLVPKLLAKMGDVIAAFGQWAKDNGPGILRQLGEWTAQFVAWVGTDLVPKLVDKMGDVIAAFGRWAKDNGPAFLGQLGEWTGQFLLWLGGLGVKLGEWAIGNAPKLLGWLVDVAPKILVQLGEWTLKFVEWVAIDLPRDLGAGALKLAGKLFGWVADLAGEIPGQVGKWTVKFVEWLVTLPVDLGKKALELAGKGLGWIADMAGNIPEQLGKWTAKFVSWVGGLPADLAGGFGDMAEKLGGMILDAFKGAWNTAANFINKKTPFGDPIPTFDMGDAGAVHANGPWTGSDGQTMPALPGKTGADNANLSATVGLKIATRELEETVQKAFDAVRPSVQIEPTVTAQDMAAVADKLGKGINTALKNPGNAIALLLDDPDFQGKVRTSAAAAVAATNANPPVKVQPTVDDGHVDTEVSTKTAAAIAKTNATAPKITPTVDDGHVDTEVSTKTGAAVAKTNATPPATLKPTVSQEHVDKEVDTAHGGAVAKTSAKPPATLKPTVSQEHVDTEVATTHAAAVVKTNADATKPKVQPAVDEDFHASAIAGVFERSVAGLNGYVNRARVRVEADQDHLNADLGTKGQAAVNYVSGLLGGSGQRLIVQTKIDPDQLLAEVLAAFAKISPQAYAAIGNVFNALGNVPDQGSSPSGGNTTTALGPNGQPVQAVVVPPGKKLTVANNPGGLTLTTDEGAVAKPSSTRAGYGEDPYAPTDLYVYNARGGSRFDPYAPTDMLGRTTAPTAKDIGQAVADALIDAGAARPVVFNYAATEPERVSPRDRMRQVELMGLA